MIVCLATKLEIGPTILMFPLPILYVFIFSLGIGLILSSYAVFFRDLLHLYSVVLMLWMYLTPIFYPITIVPEKFIAFIKLNPIYYYIEYFRSILLYNEMPTLSLNLICLGYSFFFLILGIFVFSKKQDDFILYI